MLRRFMARRNRAGPSGIWRAEPQRLITCLSRCGGISSKEALIWLTCLARNRVNISDIGSGPTPRGLRATPARHALVAFSSCTSSAYRPTW